MPELGATVNVVRLPWGAWHGDRQLELPAPSAWSVETLTLAGGTALDVVALARALDEPLGAAPLEQLAAAAQSAAIAIDDATRPARTSAVLRLVVERLMRGGLPARAIRIVVASGAHRGATRRDVELKVGADLLESVDVVAHDPEGDLVDTGVALAGVSVRLNRTFAAADLRIGVGGVMPHPFAGYSGGGKLVIPGLADLDTLARTHKYALMGFRGGSGLEGNRFRSDMEAAVSAIGLHWSVNLVVNERRDTTFVAAGDFVQAHRAAAKAAARVGATAPPTGPLDAIVVNAYPKDSELLQIEAALVALRSGMLEWLTPTSPVVLTGACPEGVGTHGLFGRGGRLFRVPSAKPSLRGRPLWILAEGVDQAGVRDLFFRDYPYFGDWPSLAAALDRVLPRGARVGVVPCGPLQVAREREQAS